MEQIVFWAIWAALAVFMGYFYLHHAHGIRSFLRGTGTGLVALLLVTFLFHLYLKNMLQILTLSFFLPLFYTLLFYQYLFI